MASTLNVVVGESSANKTLKAHVQCIEMAPEKLLAFHCSKLSAIILQIVMSKASIDFTHLSSRKHFIRNIFTEYQRVSTHQIIPDSRHPPYIKYADDNAMT